MKTFLECLLPELVGVCSLDPNLIRRHEVPGRCRHSYHPKNEEYGEIPFKRVYYIQVMDLHLSYRVI